ncbi:MAG: transcriptional repressor LexA [Chloroflexota bacterium]
MKTLSIKQQKILDFMSKFWSDNGFPPTIRDIVRACKISSTSVAAYNLNILEREGYIRRHSGVSRGIELKSRSLGRLQVPVIGQIAAGKPIPVPSPDTWDTMASSETIEVTPDLTGGKQEIYALKVKGSSMIDNLIGDGDTVLMQYVNTVENGETAAVWLKAEKEATLKKVYRESGRIRLQPANKNMKPIFTKPGNVEIQGKVVAVIRKLT